MDSRRTAAVVLSVAGQAKAAIGGATTAANGSRPALAYPALEPQKVEAKQVKLQRVEAGKLVDRVGFR
jgi:hypothetical protein